VSAALAHAPQPIHRINIVQGEHAAWDRPGTVISTLLGSCIAVCLYDPVSRVGGMNHFLLGAPEAGARLSPADRQRYGVHAMELLVNALMAMGAGRDRLRAHVYGGATMVAGLGGIGTANAEFARRFVAAEGFALGRFDTGGTRARKVEFQPHEGRARAMLVTDAVPLAPLRPVATVLRPDRAAPAGELELF